MRVRWLLVGALGLVVSLSSCGGDVDDPDAGPLPVDAGPVDAGPIATDAGPRPVDAGSPDAGGDAEDAGPLGTVAWTTEVEPMTIDGDIGADFLYAWELSIASQPLRYELWLERCVTIAGMAETCSSEQRDHLAETGGVRWGYDPSQYAVGENRYGFRLELMKDGVVVAEDELELVLTVTSCESCVGSGS